MGQIGRTSKTTPAATDACRVGVGLAEEGWLILRCQQEQMLTEEYAGQGELYGRNFDLHDAPAGTSSERHASWILVSADYRDVYRRLLGPSVPSCDERKQAAGGKAPLVTLPREDQYIWEEAFVNGRCRIPRS